jgi:hypothetical protein
VIDFDKLVLAPCQAVFGEPATFTPVASAPGAPSFAGRGIYTERSVDVQLVDGSVLSSAEKWLDIRLSEIAIVPAQGDRVALRGKLFAIEDLDEDGQGGARLTLKELRE